jgi:hypothetical protein
VTDGVSLVTGSLAVGDGTAWGDGKASKGGRSVGRKDWLHVTLLSKVYQREEGGQSDVAAYTRLAIRR